MSSSRRLPSRWGLVAAGVVLALLAGGAFALGVFGGEATVLDRVPEEADAVAQIDGAIVDDAETRELGNAALDAAGYESVTVGAALAAVQLQTGLGADDVERVVVYGRYDEGGRLDSEYAAAIVRANWSTDSLMEAPGTVGWQYRQVDVNGITVFRPRDGDPVSIGGVSIEPLTVAVLDDGTYAIGTGAAVDDAVAVANGNAASVDGPLRATVAASDDGLVTVASTVAGQWTEELDARTQGITRLDQVRAVAATYDTPEDGDAATTDASGNALRVRVRMHTEGTEAARDVAAFTRGGLPVLEHRVANATVAHTLDAATVERVGTDVTVMFETTIDDLRKIATHYGLIGGDGTGGQS